MWLKALEFVLSSASYLYAFWQRIRLKQQVKQEVIADEKVEADKAVKQAEEVRANSVGNADLLLDPEQRGHNSD